MLVAGITLSILAVRQYLNILDSFFIILVMSGAVINYVLHEFAHKFLATKYGYYAEYRILTGGALLTALGIIPFFPIKFIAPGAVTVSSSASSEDAGKIALAGPFTNLVLAGIFLTLSGLGNRITPFVGNSNIATQLSIAFYILALISVTIAFFNMIPFGPLDGVKVLNWDTNLFLFTFIFTMTCWMTVFGLTSRLLI